MKLAWMFVAWALIAVVGCTSSPCSTGFYAGFNKPPTIAGYSVLAPQVTTFAGQGIASGPVGGQLGLYSTAAADPAPQMLPMPSVSRSSTARPSAALESIADNCTLKEVCARLALMEAAMRSGTFPSAYRAMPSAKE